MSNTTSDSTNTSETDRRVHYQLPMIIKIDENLFHFIDNFYYFSTIAFVLFVNWIYLVLYLIMKKYEVVFIDLDSVGYFVWITTYGQYYLRYCADIISIYC